MRVLILGGSGIIGSFIDKKLKKDYQVISTCNDSNNYEGIYNKLDLTSKSEITTFIKNNDYFDVIIFFVGLAHKKGKNKDIDDFRKINLKTAVNLLEALKKQHKIPEKFIFCSTISVYGERVLIEEYIEDTKTIPLSPYAITKLECENYLIKFLDKDKLWILRLAPVYSKYYKKNIDRRTRIKNVFYKVGDGDFKLSLCNIKNIHIVIDAIINKKVPQDKYNISDENYYTYNDLLKFMNIKYALRIPIFLIKQIQYLGKITNNIFLIENSIKLTSNNIFPSKKIQKFLELKFKLIK